MSNNDIKIELCLTLNEELKKMGELRELDRKIAIRRKELGFLSTKSIEDNLKTYGKKIN